MKFSIFSAAIAFLMPSCHSEDAADSAVLGLLQRTQAAQERRVQEAVSLVDANGWLTPHDCDGFLWTGKFAAVTGIANMRASEFEGERGRFGRRPPPRCWEGGEDRGSQTTWSKDMAVAGLLPYVLLQRDLALLEDHLRHGKRNSWIMGRPFKLQRVVYTPALVRSLRNVRKYLKSGERPRRWFALYPKGLEDYQAHLQMMAIWLRLEVSGRLPGVAVQRIHEHIAREPSNQLYAAIGAQHSSDWSRAAALCAEDTAVVPSYVRCQEARRCQLAESIFACHLVERGLRRDR